MTSNNNQELSSKEIALAWAIMIVPVLVLIGVLIFADKIDGWDGTRVQGYPCELAEISPDIPIEVKQKCRKLRSAQL